MATYNNTGRLNMLSAARPLYSAMPNYGAASPEAYSGAGPSTGMDDNGVLVKNLGEAALRAAGYTGPMFAPAPFSGGGGEAGSGMGYDTYVGAPADELSQWLTANGYALEGGATNQGGAISSLVDRGGNALQRTYGADDRNFLTQSLLLAAPMLGQVSGLTAGLQGAGGAGGAAGGAGGFEAALQAGTQADALAALQAYGGSAATQQSIAQAMAQLGGVDLATAGAAGAAGGLVGSGLGGGGTGGGLASGGGLGGSGTVGPGLKTAGQIGSTIGGTAVPASGSFWGELGKAAIGPAISAGTQIIGANMAAGQVQDATNSSNALLKSMYDTTRADNMPALQARNSALEQMQALLKDPSSLTSQPGYQFGLSEGTKTLNNGAAARGMTYSGAQGKALQRFGQDYAGTKLDQSFNRLSSLASGGQPGAGMIGSAGQNYGNTVGNNLTAQGNVNAMPYIVGANALGNGINGLTAYGERKGWWGTPG